ncbi:photosystem II stability/assembly factor-like uncharacterized protein [Bradyrhizobium elkanii]|uniref:Photosynthesis system II assembly factor Ycf48/Hcf136-like domain-containing protein n=1 Tax=Bradyrhizobium japonicum TaxID=375 RepID=A0A1L3F6K4_BRAJP|nr:MULTISPECIES: sialidase family protein [Bradyrhizobium]APG08852.1 hypothetical protein BKD09_10965 [Bradyrhizobium japonicum]MCS3927127.1 photosystem II stability/assembly factor-like uncharacterized protein [Bradyrhizobium elkanii]MCS3967680.1 photosystem II stability/assembly factor-like uncharacterized protein [Bradyrhizobium japonicum]
MKCQMYSALFLAVVGFALPAQSQPSPIDWTLEEFQPNLPYGGRADTIAVNPSDNRTMFVASESGGLFKTTDGGTHWSHVDTLGAYYTSAVAYVTSDILLATATDRFSVRNEGGGIWRSSDGGVTWSHIPSPSLGGPRDLRFDAREISIAPDTGDIFVATSYGVAKSSDQGASWIVRGPINFAAISVSAQSGNLVIAGSNDSRFSTKVIRSDDGGATWAATNFPVPVSFPVPVFDLHALAASPLDANTFYAYGDPDFFVSEDGGVSWSKIVPTFSRGPQDFCGGIGFVKPLATPTGLTLWLGNRCTVAKLVAPQIPGTSRFDYSGPVIQSTADHWDTRDISFRTQGPDTGAPLLLATDGGLHRTLDGGVNWTLTGSGPNGYNALQITEVKGQWIDNLAKYDLYITVQDNGIWASGDGGMTWPPPNAGPEGLNIEMQKHFPSPADSVVTVTACGPCTNKVGGRVFSQTYGAAFSGLHQWPDPPGPVVGHPTSIFKSFHDQGVDDTPGKFLKGFAATHDLGSSWTQYAVVPAERRDIPKLSAIRVAHRQLPVQYQAIRTGFDATRNFEIVHLVRLTMSPPSTMASVYFPAMNGFGGIGISPPDWDWHHVFGVDPKDSQHLIAPDVINGKIMESHDGGDNWSEIPGLTSLVTDAGRFQSGAGASPFNIGIFPAFPFDLGHFPFASHVSFSGDDPNSVAIGTQQNGLFVSRDRGATWIKVPNSERATAITSIDWMSPTDAFVSTLGRGLWKLTGSQVVTSVRPLCVIQSCRIKYIFKGDPSPDRFKRGIVVFEGEIMGARVEAGALRELSVTPQTSLAFVGAPVKLAIRYTNQRIGIIGIETNKTFALPSGRLLTGLAMDERGGLFGALYTSGRIPLSDKSATRRDVRTADARFFLQQNRSPTLSKPYISLSATGKGMDNVEPEDPLTLTGERMPSGAVLEIVLDGSAIGKTEGDRSGFLKTIIKAPRELGPHTLIVRDANTKRTIDGASFVVRHRDAE